MPAERVVDASVMAAAFFEEALSDEARRFVLAMPRLIAPDHLHIEIASVAAIDVARVRARGTSPHVRL